VVNLLRLLEFVLEAIQGVGGIRVGAPPHFHQHVEPNLIADHLLHDRNTGFAR
jgi:hypothetical protein